MISKEEMINFSREALGLSESVPIELFPFGRRGSDRKFFRLKWNQRDSAILVQYDPKRVENRYYADIATFLREIGVPVPRLICHDPGRCLIVMEDMGDADLWSLRNDSWETRTLLYQKTLAIMNRLHSFPVKDFPLTRVKLMDGYDLDLYHWEQDYFIDHFIGDVCKINLNLSFKHELESELSKLAVRLNRTKRCLVHRDFQSQNVMVHSGEPFLIDFQGMRFGSPFYDLGSLHYDPYVTFSDDERDELLSFYYRLNRWELDWVAFQHTFREASAQRLMQALGAYGHLGIQKGLKAFLNHIPNGLRNLNLATSQAGSLPKLQELSKMCQKSIEKK